MAAATLILTARDVAALLDLPSCIEAVTAGLRAHARGETAGPTSLGLPLALGSFHVKAATLTAGGRTVVAAKANVNLPGNEARTGRPTIQGALVLADAGTGQPLALMDSIVLTTLRTGAVAAVAARHLARTDASVATIVGCGEQGHVQLRALAAVRPLSRAFVLDLDAVKARAMAARLTTDLGFPVETTTDLDAAVAASDVCITCTSSARAFIEARHLHPGLFIAAMGADNPHKQEIDPPAMAAARVVVDSLPACAQSGDLHHAIAAGVMADADVHADLADLAAGRANGRTRPDEVFIFDSVGTAIQDVAAAWFVYRKAVERGVGMAVDLGAR